MICYLFPGQGSQATGMGADLFDEFPEVTDIANNLLGYSIKELCLRNEKKQLNNTQYTQPAIYVVNTLSYLKMTQKMGKFPDFVAGHSLGEYNALYAAGAISFVDGLKLVKRRGELMSQAGEGAMAAILGMTKDDIQECLRRNDLEAIDIANFNGPTQIVISGLPEDIKKAQIVFEKAGGGFIQLNTSGAFHSRYMQPIKIEFEKFLEQFEFSDLKIPVISNIHATPYKKDQIKNDLANQITHSVNWRDSMRYLLQLGVTKFEELGNGQVLSKLMVNIKSNYSVVGNNSQNPSEVKDTSQKTGHIENSMEDLRSQVESWNKHYVIGTRVKITGFKEELLTRSEAMMILNNKAVIYVHGFKGYFALNKVSAISASRS